MSVLTEDTEAAVDCRLDLAVSLPRSFGIRLLSKYEFNFSMSSRSNVFLLRDEMLLMIEPLDIAEATLRVVLFESLTDGVPNELGRTPTIKPSGNFFEANFKPFLEKIFFF